MDGTTISIIMVLVVFFVLVFFLIKRANKKNRAAAQEAVDHSPQAIKNRLIAEGKSEDEAEKEAIEEHEAWVKANSQSSGKWFIVFGVCILISGALTMPSILGLVGVVFGIIGIFMGINQVKKQKSEMKE